MTKNNSPTAGKSDYIFMVSFSMDDKSFLVFKKKNLFAQ